MPPTPPQNSRRALLASLPALAGAGLALPAFAQESPADPTKQIDVRRTGAVGDAVADDGPAFQRAILQAARGSDYPASVHVPAGRYRRAAPIALPHRLTLEGEGAASILDSQNDPGFTAPILTNAQPYGLVGLRLRNLALHGGSHGLYLDTNKENADLVIEEVTMLLQSVANIQVNRLFQTVRMLGCTLGSSRFGLRVDDWATTAFVSVGTQWIDHSDSSLWLRGVEGVTVIGGRFEGGGRVGKVSIDVERGSTLSFIGVYFENVHETLGRFRNIDNGIVFQNCQFTGTTLDGVTRAFGWDCDDSLIVFRDCSSKLPMAVDATIVLEGANHNIRPGRGVWRGTQAAGTLDLPGFELGVRPTPLIAVARIEGVSSGALSGTMEIAVHPLRGPARRAEFAVSVADTTVTITPAAGEDDIVVSVARDTTGRMVLSATTIGNPAPNALEAHATFNWRQRGARDGLKIAAARR